jgi:putative hydrolase of the HAD superfamily
VKIVFDLAGVLLRWRPEVVVAGCLPARAPDDAAARHWAGQIFQGYGGDWAEFDRGTVVVDELVSRIARRTGLSPAEVRAVVDAVPGELQPLPETAALVETLRDAGHAPYFLSNMPAPAADHVEAVHPVFRAFRDGVYSARVHAIKPEREIFEIAARRFGASPGKLLFFDDVARNVEAARAAGWQAQQFVDAAGARAELSRRGLLP